MGEAAASSASRNSVPATSMSRRGVVFFSRNLRTLEPTSNGRWYLLLLRHPVDLRRSGHMLVGMPQGLQNERHQLMEFLAERPRRPVPATRAVTGTSGETRTSCFLSSLEMDLGSGDTCSTDASGTQSIRVSGRKGCRGCRD